MERRPLHETQGAVTDDDWASPESWRLLIEPVIGPVSGAHPSSFRASHAILEAGFHAASPSVTVSVARAARIASNSIGDFISQVLCRRIRL
jgi:hypothetical protein